MQHLFPPGDQCWQTQQQSLVALGTGCSKEEGGAPSLLCSQPAPPCSSWFVLLPRPHSHCLHPSAVKHITSANGIYCHRALFVLFYLHAHIKCVFFGFLPSEENQIVHCQSLLSYCLHKQTDSDTTTEPQYILFALRRSMLHWDFTSICNLSTKHTTMQRGNKRQKTYLNWSGQIKATTSLAELNL